MSADLQIALENHPLADQPLLVQWVPPNLQRELDVPCNDQGLRSLALQGSWRSIIDKVKATKPSNPQEMLHLTTYKVLAMCKLRMYSAAFDELNSLGGLDSPQYTQHTASGQVVSLVPFAMHWIRAQLPGMLGRASYTMDELYKLANLCRQHRGDDVGGVWATRYSLVLYTLVNYYVRSKEYTSALQLCNVMLTERPHDPDVLCKVAYIQLLMGDVAAANNTIQQANTALESTTEATTSPSSGDIVSPAAARDARIQIHLNKALVLFATNDVQGALQEYDAVLQLDPHNWVAVNNKTVVTMYDCKLSPALTSLEGAFAAAPVALLQEPLLLNMSSMYELNATPYRDEVKHKIGVWVGRCGPDDFDVNCMRLG